MLGPLGTPWDQLGGKGVRGPCVGVHRRAPSGLAESSHVHVSVSVHRDAGVGDKALNYLISITPSAFIAGFPSSSSVYLKVPGLLKYMLAVFPRVKYSVR